MNREINGLLEALSFFNKDDCYIITLNQDDILTKDGKKITLISAHKWLSKFNNVKL